MFQRLILAAALVLAGLPALAQVDTRLATSTDLLDVYKTSAGKPELLSIFDFSTSMHAMYWSSLYYGAISGHGHLTSAPNGKGWRSSLPDGDAGQSGIVPILDASGKVYMTYGGGPNGTPDFSSLNYMDNSGTGRLVRPDGTLVPITGTYTQTQLTALVQQASHIRMTAILPASGSTAAVSRTIDLPIPWAILDPSATGSTPVVLTVPDTIGGGPAICPDEAYLSNNPNNIVNSGKYGAIVGETNVNYYKIGLLRYNEDYLWWIFFGKDVKNAAGTGVTATSDYAIPAVTTPTAAVPWTNGLPGMTRFQALKYCAVSTWLRNQAKVWWGFRYLDGTEQGKSTVSPDNGNASSTLVSRDIRLFRPASNSSTADPKLKNFVQTVPSGSTPLTYAFANGYTQLSLNKDASSTFGSSNQAGGQSGTENPIPACRTTFMVVFTDGIANDTSSGGGSAIGTGSDVYAQGNAAAGNTALAGSRTALQTALTPGTSGRFNMWTLAAVAAHYPSTGYTSPTSTTVTPAVGAAAPFLISDRGATTSNMRRTRTMTVGMSLFGNLTDSTGGKSSMYRAALYGNPNISTWVNPTSANPTPAYDPSNPSASDRTVNPFFFDAQSIDQLSAAMEAVVAEAITASGSVSAPSAPLVGLSLGREAFLGLFQPASTGPLWRGDLLAAGLKITSTADTFLGNDGNPVTSVNSENAIWSAGDLLQSEGLTYNFLATQYADPSTISGTGPRSWKPGYRKVLTNLSGTTVVNLDETTITANSTVGASSDADRVAYVRFLRGAHASAESSAYTVGSAPSINRVTIMGDIISSSPAVLEYPLSLASSSPVLSGVVTDGWVDKHFRVIFVADNQGYIHAFGELAGTLVTGTAPNLVQTPIAAVDELWAFFPGELLAGMAKYLRTGINGHIYGMDGPPVIYFDDQPASGMVAGDGIVNGTDVVRLIVGMGKGGRNYYAFDVKDPYSPTLAWKLVPGSSTNTVVQKMGLATSTPALARVEVSGVTTDVVFIGGGLSTKAVNTSMGVTLGRNLVALDTLTGAVVKTWDFSDIQDMGSLSAPVVPVEFLPNTGRAQRVYFTDQPFEGTSRGTGARGSGVWALGSTALASNGVIRLDSSEITGWTGGGVSAAGGLRKVYQATAGQIISTPPVPFRLGSPYPVVRTATPFLRPAVMGLLFSSGDRNDPLDRDLINPTGQNQMMMVFDRQDSASMGGLSPLPANGSGVDTSGFTDADLADLTTVASTSDARITPANDSYYLKSKFGYKLLMVAATTKTTTDAGGSLYYPKSPSAPAALDGVLFFAVLKPGNVTDASGQSVACTGTGQTTIFRMCNLMAPVFSSGNVAADLSTFNQNASSCSGSTLTFANIPGPMTGLGSVGVLVSGQGKTTTGQAGSISTAGAEAQVVPGKTQNFGFRLKTWRIVR